MNSSAVASVKTMQLATVGSDHLPWICTVYYVIHEGCFYWLSLPGRRHSREIADNPHVAIAIAIKQIIPVIGLQVEGVASQVTDVDEVASVMASYETKYNQGHTFLKRFTEGKNDHVLYRCTPSKVMYFNETVASDEPYRDITKEFYERN